jgi:hypothetical protein
MASQSITIKIDFGSDAAASTQQAVSVSGGVPTPLQPGTSTSGVAIEGMAAAPPTPFDRGGQQSVGGAAAQTGSEAPAPSPDLIPTGADRAGGAALPTPFDHPEMSRVADQQSTAPQPQDLRQIDRTAPSVPQPDNAIRKRDRK